MRPIMFPTGLNGVALNLNVTWSLLLDSSSLTGLGLKRVGAEVICTDSEWWLQTKLEKGRGGMTEGQSYVNKQKTQKPGKNESSHAACTRYRILQSVAGFLVL